jgi:osmotically-inducible protein OsmY
MAGASLTDRIEQELEKAGLHVAVEQADKRITLSGLVDSDEQRQAVFDIVRHIAPDYQIDSNLDVQMELPQAVGALTSDEPSPSDLPDSIQEIEALGGSLEPDFTDQPLLTDPTAASGSPDSWEDPVQEGDETYVPPTDPVVTTDLHGQAQVLGGFQATSDEEIDVARSALDNLPGDEAIADAVRQELREDAATTDLQILVYVREGVVHLRGRVPTLEDAENAESVAAGVPGVDEVIEELEVAGLS